LTRPLAATIATSAELESEPAVEGATESLPAVSTQEPPS
jgi:hypothetical protein